MEVKRVYPVRGLNYKVSEEYHHRFAKGEKILLEPDKDISHDKNAVGIHSYKLNNARIGFMPKEENEFYFLYLSQGGIYEAEIHSTNEASVNHSLDFLFIKVSLLLNKQSELDLFIKYNEIKKSIDLNIDRWLSKKSQFNPKNHKYSQRGYLFGGITCVQEIVMSGYQAEKVKLFSNLLLVEDYKRYGLRKTTRVQIEELPNDKYKIIAEFNEHEKKYIKINDDNEYELFDIRALRNKL